tara:strand:+ start:784 stop:1152 length:369 start_codon:yes stop_codon:yes gene_type:complete
MRKFLLAAMAVVMVMGTSRTAEALTANTLLRICESKDSKENAQCVLFLAGVSLGIQTANLARDAGTRFCLPKTLSASQLQRMFIKSANERPEMLHELAGTFIGIVTLNPFFRPTDKGICDGY